MWMGSAAVLEGARAGEATGGPFQFNCRCPTCFVLTVFLLPSVINSHLILACLPLRLSLAQLFLSSTCLTSSTPCGIENKREIGAMRARLSSLSLSLFSHVVFFPLLYVQLYSLAMDS